MGTSYSPETINVITRHAIVFRNAIENTKEDLGIVFADFPLGSCGDTALLLGAYFMECGLGDFNYVCGMKGPRSHAWLEKDGLIVDITGDQFPGGVRVYVGTKNAFYKRFKEEDIHPWYESLQGPSIYSDRLSVQYTIIKRNILEAN